MYDIFNSKDLSVIIGHTGYERPEEENWGCTTLYERWGVGHMYSNKL